MRKICYFLVLSLCLTLSACGGSGDTPTDANAPSVSDGHIVEETPIIADSQQEATPEFELMYFKSDEAVDKFFADYNSIAEIIIPAETIEKGNIKTKALIYIDDLSLEIINATDFLSISMSSSAENENIKLYAIFRDSIMAMRADTAEEDVQAVWNAIHESGYIVEDYDFNGISITYVPSKELSWGTSDLRVDMEIPFK